MPFPGPQEPAAAAAAAATVGRPLHDGCWLWQACCRCGSQPYWQGAEAAPGAHLPTLLPPEELHVWSLCCWLQVETLLHAAPRWIGRMYSSMPTADSQKVGSYVASACVVLDHVSAAQHRRALRCRCEKQAYAESCCLIIRTTCICILAWEVKREKPCSCKQISLAMCASSTKPVIYNSRGQGDTCPGTSTFPLHAACRVRVDQSADTPRSIGDTAACMQSIGLAMIVHASVSIHSLPLQHVWVHRSWE